MANWFPPSHMFFRTQIPCKQHHRNFLGSSSSSCMGDFDLARSLAALSVLQKQSSSFYSQEPPPPSLTQRVKPVGLGVSLDQVARGSCGLPGSGSCGGGIGMTGEAKFLEYGTGRHSFRTDPVYELQVRSKVDDGYLEAKMSRALLQRLQNRVPSRIYPFQGSGGTGVFHLRVADNYSSITTDDTKKQGALVRQEAQVAQQRDTMDMMRRFGVSKPALGLPREWTY